MTLAQLSVPAATTLASASQIFTVGPAWALTASLERALILRGKTLRVAVLVS